MSLQGLRLGSTSMFGPTTASAMEIVTFQLQDSHICCLVNVGSPPFRSAGHCLGAAQASRCKEEQAEEASSE